MIRTKTHISESTISKLIQEAELQTGDDLENVGFRNDSKGFDLIFYGEQGNDYEVELECYHFENEEGVFIPFTLTSKHYEQMQQRIYDTIIGIEAERMAQEAENNRPDEYFFDEYGNKFIA